MSSPALASESSSGEVAVVSSAADTVSETKAQKDERAESAHAEAVVPGSVDDAKKSCTTSSRILLVQMVLALVLGTVLGAYLAAHILETEYQSIVSRLRMEYQSSLVLIQSEYIGCQSLLSDEKRSNEEVLSQLRIRADRNERAFQERAEQYLNETNAAYRVANEGLERASSRLKEEVAGRESALFRLKEEVEKHEDTRTRLEAEVQSHESTRSRLMAVTEMHESAQSQLEEEVEKHETSRLELSQANRRLQAIRNTLTESTRSLEEAQAARNGTEKELEVLQRELDAAEEELDRRDVERVECDQNHRQLMACRESLKEALVDLANARSPASPDAASEATARVTRMLAQVTKEKEELQQRVESLKEAAKSNSQLAQVIEERDELLSRIHYLIDKEEITKTALEELEFRVEEAEREAEQWEMKSKAMVEKISHRNRKEVLEHYGPGPHRVKLTLAFPSAPVNESILVELAPLDIMPHTIHTFLNLIQKGMYSQGTFILSRSHIIVGGPVDSHDPENNNRLENLMLQEGYFPNGALLFHEYTSDYPHLPYTLAFNPAGGPIFYINLQDNSDLHGEVDGKEGDPCFGMIVEGHGVIRRLSEMPTVNGDSLEQPVYIVDTHLVN